MDVESDTDSLDELLNWTPGAGRAVPIDPIDLNIPEDQDHCVQWTRAANGPYKRCAKCHRRFSPGNFMDSKPLPDVTNQGRIDRACKLKAKCQFCRRLEKRAPGYAERAIRKKQQRETNSNQNEQADRLSNPSSLARFTKGVVKAFSERDENFIGFRGVHDLAAHLTGDIADRRTAADVLVNMFMGTLPNHPDTGYSIIDYREIGQKYRFVFRKETQLSETRARGVPQALKGSKCFTYVCSQHRSRTVKPKERPFSEQRNRQSIQAQGCGGFINIYFPSHGQLTFPDSTAQVAIKVRHMGHIGRDIGGVAEEIRKWIQDNPRPSAKQQRDECILALRNGDIPHKDEHDFISPAHCYYWWNKAQTGTHRVSEDPWENVRHRLDAEPEV